MRAGKEAFNNYGPKSNEELLLSYGFVLDSNPDDTVILKLGAPAAVSDKLRAQGLDISQRFALRVDGQVPQELLRVLRAMMGGPVGHVHGDSCDHGHDDDEDEDDEDEHAAHEKEMEEMQLEIDVLGTLGGMLEDKLDKLNVTLDADSDVRPEVVRMVEVYRKGQMEILEKTQDTLSERIDRLESMMDQGMGSCPCGC